MATSTLLSPEAPTSTTANKILNFFHSFLLFLLNTLRRALQSVSRTRPSDSQPFHSQHHFASATSDRSGLAAMSTTTVPRNRPQPPKVLPALPLIPPRRPSPEKDSKENTAPFRQEVGPLPQYQPQPQKTDAVESATESITQLDLNGIIDETSTSQSPSSPSRSSLPVYIPCPPLPIPEPLTGERAIHSGFMREALDMVCIISYYSISVSFGWLLVCLVWLPCCIVRSLH